MKVLKAIGTALVIWGACIGLFTVIIGVMLLFAWAEQTFGYGGRIVLFALFLFTATVGGCYYGLDD